MELIDIVAKLRLFPRAYVDIGYRQGREAVLEQFRNQFDQDDQHNVDRSATVDDFLSTMQNGIAELSKRAEPYALPEDYIIFLEHYGGLAIDGANYSFAIYGIGPMVETWYGYVNS